MNPVEDKEELIASPGHKLAIPLFLATSVPYFGVIAFDYLSCCGIVDKSFAWFVGFYVLLGGFYFMVKVFKSNS